MAHFQLDESEIQQIVHNVSERISSAIDYRIRNSIDKFANVAKKLPLRPTPEPIPKSAADIHWGYVFGVNGLMSFEDARRWLGDCSRSTLGRLVTDQKIRKGQRRGGVVFCVRSVLEYAESVEV